MFLSSTKLQMGEVDMAWALYRGLKASGVEPADYPTVNQWMAKQAIAGISNLSSRHSMVSLQTCLL